MAHETHPQPQIQIHRRKTEKHCRKMDQTWFNYWIE